MSNNPWGRDDLMVIAAVRYCLGRMTYIVGDCADWLIEQWPDIKPSARKIIQRDIEEEFVRDDLARKSEDDYQPLGGDCDRAQWERVRRLWAKDRTEYQRAYYERTKEARKSKRKKSPRTAATIAAEKRYREKRRLNRSLLKDIAEMPVPTFDAERRLTDIFERKNGIE